MGTALSERECVPCQGGLAPLKGDALSPLSQELSGAWSVIDEHHLHRVYIFKDFVDGLAFVNRVADIAENVNHHPDLHLSWGKVMIDIWTHKIDGLSESDFVLAAKIDRLMRLEP